MWRRRPEPSRSYPRPLVWGEGADYETISPSSAFHYVRRLSKLSGNGTVFIFCAVWCNHGRQQVRSAITPWLLDRGLIALTLDSLLERPSCT